KRDGRPLYEYARAGIELEREGREVIIHDLQCTGWHGEVVKLSVTCSKGTYIRVLAEDLGKLLGCGAHLTALRRTQVGRLSVIESVT
ncbi:tRNA pseudouridine(55) synthase TruB, partial [Acinetobacter baumannii]